MRSVSFLLENGAILMNLLQIANPVPSLKIRGPKGAADLCKPSYKVSCPFMGLQPSWTKEILEDQYLFLKCGPTVHREGNINCVGKKISYVFVAAGRPRFVFKDG